MKSSTKTSADTSLTSDTWTATLSKALRSGSDWTDKDELLDVIYWARQILGAIFGIFWGIVPFYGFFGILMYLVATTFIVHFYTTSYQNTDDEKLGGFWEVAKEGFASSFATFMIAWIIVYTAFHADHVLL